MPCVTMAGTFRQLTLAEEVVGPPAEASAMMSAAILDIGPPISIWLEPDQPSPTMHRVVECVVRRTHSASVLNRTQRTTLETQADELLPGHECPQLGLRVVDQFAADVDSDRSQRAGELEPARVVVADG